MLEIRERTPEEAPLDVEIYNSASPPEWQMTLEQVRIWESMDRPDDKMLRLLAILDGQAIGAAHSVNKPHHPAGRFRIDVAVRPEFQHRGFGTSIYQKVREWSTEQGATSLELGVEQRVLPRVERWLEREGFREVSRMRPSQLELANFDPAAHADAVEGAYAVGVTFTTFDKEDNDEARRKLWALSNIVERDVPWDTEHEEMPFDRFEERLDAPNILRGCLVIAKHGDDYVGFSSLGRDDEQKAMTMMTGVHPDYRGHGIARAMKVQSAKLARENGFRVMRTFNHVNNPRMLAVNDKLGYVEMPHFIAFVKSLKGS